MLHTLFLVTSLNLNLPPGLLEAVCKVESNFKVTALHRNDGKGHSYGVCQIKYNTAKLMGYKGSEKDLMRPEINIRYAGLYLRHQINRYKSIPQGIIAYNQGSAKGLTNSTYQRKVFKEWQIGSTFINGIALNAADIPVDVEQSWKSLKSLNQLRPYQSIQMNVKNTPYLEAYYDTFQQP